MHVARLRENHRKRWALLLLLVAVVLATAGGLAAVKAVAATSGHQSQAQAVKVAQLIKSGHVAKGAQGTECTSGPGKLCWDGKKGAGACPAGTTGNMLVIFNPHSDAVPVSLTVTWSNGETDIYTGWTESGQGQDWHITVDIVGKFPPQSFYVAYTGTLGNNPVLTISGCNETGGTTTTGTGTTETTTTGGTTTGGTSTNSTTTNVTTTNVTTTNVTTTNVTTTNVTTTPSPPKHHKPKHHKPKVPRHPHPTNTE
jgi:hypothetical protein